MKILLSVLSLQICLTTLLHAQNDNSHLIGLACLQKGVEDGNVRYLLSLDGYGQVPQRFIDNAKALFQQNHSSVPDDNALVAAIEIPGLREAYDGALAHVYVKKPSVEKTYRRRGVEHSDTGDWETTETFTEESKQSIGFSRGGTPIAFTQLRALVEKWVSLAQQTQLATLIVEAQGKLQSVQDAYYAAGLLW